LGFALSKLLLQKAAIRAQNNVFIKQGFSHRIKYINSIYKLSFLTGIKILPGNADAEAAMSIAEWF